MSLLVCGINHHTTPIGVREKLSFDAKQLPFVLKDITQSIASEAVILSTCNRTEIYATAVNTDAVQDWLAYQKKINEVDLNAYCYMHHDKEAVRHMMRVASGLDSMVLGESQIFGQLKQAYQIAQEANTVGDVFNQLFPVIFATGKYIRSETQIGAHAISLAFVITQLLKKYNVLENGRVLLIGAGDTIQSVALHMHSVGIKNMTIASRHLEKSQAIAERVSANTIHIQDIPDALPHHHIVISATTSQLPILGKGLIERTLKSIQHPLFLIDLAVPRDIEPEVATLENVHLFNIDDLQTLISNNLNNRFEAAKQAETLIDIEAHQFFQKMRVYHASDVITAYRQRLEKIQSDEQEKAIRQIQNGHDPRLVLAQFGHNLINKIMHHPTVKLREAASEDECEIFQRIKVFFE